VKSVELKRQLQKINELIKSTAVSTNENVELQGHWGKYICVLSAGFLENAISEIYISLVENSSAPHVASFAGKTLNKIQNPKSTKFVEIASSFREEWGNEIENLFLNDPSIKNAVDSIMTNRHLIAHGKSTSISVIRVKEYLEKSLKLIEFIEKQCGIS
jgi:hypothetical protein